MGKFDVRGGPGNKAAPRANPGGKGSMSDQLKGIKIVRGGKVLPHGARKKPGTKRRINDKESSKA